MPTITLAPNGDTLSGVYYQPCGIFPLLPATHYDKVQTNDGDTTYIWNDQNNGPNEADLFTFPGPGLPLGSTINSVTVHSVVKKVSIGATLANLFYHLLVTYGTKYESSHTVMLNYADYSDTYLVNPFTLNPWDEDTLHEITNLVTGVRLTYSQLLARITYGQCTQTYIIVDYTPPVSAVRLRRLLVGEGL